MIKSILSNSVIMIFIGLITCFSLYSFSWALNPGYGWFGLWVAFLGASFCIYMFTRVYVRFEHTAQIKGIHWGRPWLRGAVMLLITYVAFPLHIYIPSDQWFLPVIFWVGLWFAFGIPFDPSLNRLNGKPFFYSGTEAGYDRLNKGNPIAWFIGECVCWLAALIFFILYNYQAL